MSHRPRTGLLLMLMLLGIFLLNPASGAAAPVAKVSQFSGEVLVVTGDQVSRVTSAGHPVNQGDAVQTKNGEAQITFNDGALMTLRPYTSTVLQEAEEQRGWFLFKTKDLVRRITCQVGNLWFKSGASARKNYLQSPTAVCGLRGSAVDFGFNNVMTYVRQIEGGSDLSGAIQRVTEDFFRNLQANAQQAAGQNAVYNKLNEAYNKAEQANKTGAPIDTAGAKVAVLDAVKTSLQAILANPNLTDAAREALNSVLTQVNQNLTDAQNQLNTLTQTTTTVAPTTTSVAPTTTSVAETTTSAADTTTTTQAPTTTTVSIPTTTTTTVTTTTSSAASPTSSF